MVKQEHLLSIRGIAESLFGLMNFQVNVSVHASGDDVRINVTGNDRAYLITDNGETILSLQHILARMIQHQLSEAETYRIFLDTDGFMFRHEQSLRRMAEQAALQVRRERRDVMLPSMNPYDRKIVHIEVARNVDLNSVSDGDGFFKRVVVYRKSGR